METDGMQALQRSWKFVFLYFQIKIIISQSIAGFRRELIGLTQFAKFLTKQVLNRKNASFEAKLYEPKGVKYEGRATNKNVQYSTV